MVWNDYGNLVIDDREYVPARLRAVVMSFIENRYGYDYQNLQKINSALRLMSESAQIEERERIRALDLTNTVVANRVKKDVRPDYSRWRVVPLGGGRFDIEVPIQVATTSTDHPDPRNPLITSHVINLTVQTVPATDINPLGYVIVSTGRDIL